MALNPNITQLDTAQVTKRVYDPINDAYRVSIGDINGLSFSLSAASGDNVTALPNSLDAKVSLTSASSGDVIAATSCVGMKTFNIAVNTTSTLVGPQSCVVYLSPSDTDNVWVASTLNLSPSTTSGTAVLGSSLTAMARRVKVTLVTPITSGTFDLYLMAQSV